MNEFLLSNEGAVRLGTFVGVFSLMAAAEMLAPRRKLTLSKAFRWANNLGLIVFSTLVLRLAFPFAAAGTAALGQSQGWGLLNILGVPFVLAVLLSILAMDLAIYLQHVMFHAVPVLWRLHRVHHADLDFDVTTGIRFHPIEILISMAIKMAIVAALGPPVAAVIAFEVLLNASSLFNHGNVRLPDALDRALRWFIVTPDMHRVHHSVLARETNSNYGFSLSWWDRLLGTYRRALQGDQETMAIGIEQFREPRFQRLDWLLLQPFLADRSSAAGQEQVALGGGDTRPMGANR